MLYFIVMGSLALSLAFSVGWVLWRSGRWLLGRLPGSGRQAKASGRKAPARKPKPPAGKSPRKVPSTRRAPWAITRGLAQCGSILPLTPLVLLVYGGLKLAERGMANSPRTPPAGFYDLVITLGWLALGLMGISLIVLIARWRCRET